MKSHMLRTTRVLSLSGLLLLLPYTAAASTLAEELKACSGISNVMERLVCYDELAERADELAAESGEGLPEAAAAGQRRAAEARERGEGQRGEQRQGQGRELSEEAQQRAEQRRREAERRADEAERRAEESERRAQEAERRAEQEREQRQSSEPITDKTYIDIVDAWQNPRGLWRFELATGEVYEQTNSNRLFQYQEGENYYLDPGFLNSLSLGRDGSNTKIRVRKRN